MARKQSTSTSSANKRGDAPATPKKRPSKRQSTRKKRGGLAGFDFKALNQQYVTSKSPINDAGSYGVTIQPATVPAGAIYWQAVGVHHLTPEENRSRHNIFVDALGEDGQRTKEAQIGWTWEGNNNPPHANRLDKPDDEPGTDIPIFDGLFRLWVAGNEPSDTVSGIHFHHEDERTTANEILNSKGHHSFYVVFQRTQKEADNSPTIDPGTTTDAKTPPVVTPQTQWMGNITATLLNVRTGPGTEHATVGSLPENSQVEVTGQAGKWLQILWQGGSAFVHSDFVIHHDAVRLDFGHDTMTDHLIPPPGADPTTIAVANTWNRHRALLVRESTRLGIDPGIAVAILVTESKGDSFGADGRMIIRFENHIFFDEWGQHNRALFSQHFSFDPVETWKKHHWSPAAHSGWQRCHTHQSIEWMVFDFARGFNEEAAMRSISMGTPQIMGFNHRNIGYATVQDMFHAFRDSEEAQLTSLFRFMEGKGLVTAVQQGDFRSFARAYNGSGQVDIHSGIIMRNLAAFRALTGERSRDFGLEPADSVRISPIAEDAVLAAAWNEQLHFGLAHSRKLLESMLAHVGAAAPNDSIRMAQLGIVLNSYWGQLAFQSSAELIKNAGAEAAAQLGSIVDDPAKAGTATNGIGSTTSKVSTIAAEEPNSPQPTSPPVTDGGNRGKRKRALCIGIDQYAQQPLSGCVADAQLWAGTLLDMGFEEPLQLRNEAATREAIINAIKNLVAGSQPGDVVVIQYAGHGTQLADISGDESDGDSPNQDEALVPYDYTSGAYVIDDDLGAIFSNIPAGVNVTCFMDCCHSGSISRDIVSADEQPRFMVADPEMLKAHHQYRQLLGRSRSSGKRDVESMREVVFSACQSYEVAWESGGHGEFTLRATTILKNAPAMPSHATLMAQINEAFGPSPRQNPLLECATEQRERTLFETS